MLKFKFFGETLLLHIVNSFGIKLDLISSLYLFFWSRKKLYFLLGLNNFHFSFQGNKVEDK